MKIELTVAKIYLYSYKNVINQRLNLKQLKTTKIRKL